MKVVIRAARQLVVTMIKLLEIIIGTWHQEKFLLTGTGAVRKAYCLNCLGTFDYPEDEKGKQQLDNLGINTYDFENMDALCCDHCGMISRSFVLQNAIFSGMFDDKLTELKVFHIPEERKLKILGRICTYSLGSGRKLKNGTYAPARVYLGWYNRTFTVHYDTGQCFSYTGQGAHGIKQIAYSGEGDSLGYVLKACTNRARAASEKCVDIICEFLEYYHLERTGIVPVSYREIDKVDNMLRIVKLAKAPYMPCGPYTQSRQMYYTAFGHTNKKGARKFLKVINKKAPDVMKDLFDTYGLCKWERKFASENMHLMPYIIPWRGVIRSVDILKVVLTAIYGKGHNHGDDFNAGITEFTKALIDIRGEKGIMDFFGSISYEYHLTDSVRMYLEFQAARRSGSWDGKLDLTGTMKDVHDRMSLDYKKMGTPLIQFEEQPYQIKLVDGWSNDDMIFRVAKTNHELINVGSKMNICVGSYWRQMLAAELTIVVGYKAGEPTVCLELDRTCKVLRQAKLAHNKCVIMDDYYSDCTKQFLETSKVSFADCYDMTSRACDGAQVANGQFPY